MTHHARHTAGEDGGDGGKGVTVRVGALDSGFYVTDVGTGFGLSIFARLPQRTGGQSV